MITMLRRTLHSAALRRVGRQYARRLKPRLQHDYGAGNLYTAEQIQVAAKKCDLSPDYISIGYAAFMPEKAFNGLAGAEGDYSSLRNLFQQFESSKSIGGFEPAPESWVAMSYDASRDN